MTTWNSRLDAHEAEVIRLRKELNRIFFSLPSYRRRRATALASLDNTEQQIRETRELLASLNEPTLQAYCLTPQAYRDPPSAVSHA